jgi:hypothetical protein
MRKEHHYYEVIKKILAECRKRSCPKEEIKMKIVDAIGGADYITALTAYLWGAYNNFDSDAKVAFKEVFSDDLRTQNPSAFYFFSYYFLNDFKRTGFDRRNDSDRRNSYSLDFFHEKIIERRQGGDRRKDLEKRLNWTRVTKWVSVPFNVDGGDQGGDKADSPAGERLQQIDNGVMNKIPARPGAEMDIRSLNAILSALIIYFDTYINHGQTGWLNNVNEEIFERAKNVMSNIIEK